MFGYGKFLVSGRRKPASRSGRVRTGLAKLTARRQQAIAHRNQKLQICYGCTLRTFKAEGQIHEGQAVQPQIAAKGHVVRERVIFRQASRLTQGRINGGAHFRRNICRLWRTVLRHGIQNPRLAALPEKTGHLLRRPLRLIIKLLQPGVEHALVARAGQITGFHKLHRHGAAGREEQQVGNYRQRTTQQHPAKMRRFARGPVAESTAPQPGCAHQHHAQAGHFLQNKRCPGVAAKALPA